MITLTQTNTKNHLEEWSNDIMPVATGEMSECISIIYLGEQNHRGIHCGGGISKDEAEQINELFAANGFVAKQKFVIFGISYKENTNSQVFSINDTYKYFGKDCIVLCSSNATIYSELKWNAKFSWDPQESSWKECNNVK